MYPLGTAVVVKNTIDNTQTFLNGHTNQVTCVAISRCGRFIASGQKTEIGQRAPIYLWDFATAVTSILDPAATLSSPLSPASVSRGLIHKLVQHKCAIQSLSFSCDSAYLASLGGIDDNNLMVWETETGKAVVCTPAASHAGLAVSFYSNRNDRLVTAGQYHLRNWEFNIARRRLFPDEMKLTGGLKRVFCTATVDESDRSAYFGTTSGDILQYNLQTGHFMQASSHRFSQGIVSAALCPGGSDLIVGTGDGALVKVNAQTLATTAVSELIGAVSSVALSAAGDEIWATTEAGNLYRADIVTLKPVLASTCYPVPIRDVCFPEGISDIFITAGGTDIRIWNTAKRAELLRIQVPNIECLCVAINKQGSLIVSGWNDGKVRAFLPESGKLQFVISDAHAEAVTAVCFTNDGKRLVTGGKEGRVRVWNVANKGGPQTMELSFKEHKKEVTEVRVSANDEEAISASADGSCLMWNIKRGTRANGFFASTVFRTLAYHPDESQIVTAGSDRKLTYIDASDCTAIRVMDGSTEEINSIDIDRSGRHVASCGYDRTVRYWLYDEGDLVAIGGGHSGPVNKVKISPDNKIMVSVGSEGGIFIWRVPK